MDCSFHLTMSLSFLQPSSRIKVWVICLHSGLFPISNGWNVAQRHNREEIRVECRQGKIRSLWCVCLQTRQICEVVIVMKHVVEAVKEGINRKHYRRPSRGARELDRHHETGAEQHSRNCSWKELWLTKAVLDRAFVMWSWLCKHASVVLLSWKSSVCFWEEQVMAKQFGPSRMHLLYRSSLHTSNREEPRARQACRTVRTSTTLLYLDEDICKEHQGHMGWW